MSKSGNQEIRKILYSLFGEKNYIVAILELHRVHVVAASLRRGVVEHGDRAPWLDLGFRAETRCNELFGATDNN